ncbi:MAG: four helix bundle protein [Candidatus Paceibacterota bacterium]
MSNQAQNPNVKNDKIYDLAERTALFGESIIEFMSCIPTTNINNPLINQLVRSSTSIGANYMEADGAESKKDFNHKIGICKKEAKETMHWIRMIAKANSGKTIECRKLWNEAHELTLIFSSIIRPKPKVQS